MLAMRPVFNRLANRKCRLWIINPMCNLDLATLTFRDFTGRVWGSSPFRKVWQWLATGHVKQDGFLGVQTVAPSSIIA